MLRQTFKLNVVEVAGGIKFHSIPDKKESLRPYLLLNAGYALPVAYNSQDYYLDKESRSVEDLSNGFATGRVGTGGELQKEKWGVSLEYGLTRKNLFNRNLNRTFRNEDDYSAPNATLLGAVLGIRSW